VSIPVRTATPVQPAKALTVDQIVKQIEQRKTQPIQPKRAALPEADAPVDEATIARAEVPPRIKSDISTAPSAVQAVMKLPVGSSASTAISRPIVLRKLQNSRAHERTNQSAMASRSILSILILMHVNRSRCGNKPQSVFDR